MAKSRLQMRRESEAAENDAKASPKAVKKKATRKKAATRRTREKVVERKRAVWVLYSSSMKEEGRFSYDQKTAAEDRLKVLQARGKKVYFMQLVKELITGEGPVAADPEPQPKDARATGTDEDGFEDTDSSEETGTEDMDFDADVESEDDDGDELSNDEDE
ncbi:MAG: hypothetical protein VB858_22420 [Planctomycetaceae bacterium]